MIELVSKINYEFSGDMQFALLLSCKKKIVMTKLQLRIVLLQKMKEIHAVGRVPKFIRN